MSGLISPLSSATDGYIVDLETGDVIYSRISTQCRIKQNLFARVKGRLIAESKLHLSATITNHLHSTVKRTLGATICP